GLDIGMRIHPGALFGGGLLAEMDIPARNGINRELINDAIDTLRLSNFRNPNFSRSLEEQLERDTAQERSRRLWREGRIAMGVLIMALFTNVVMRVRFLYATAATAVMLAGGLWFASNAGGLTESEETIGASLMAIGVAVTLTAGYSLEREERLGYLLFLRSE